MKIIAAVCLCAFFLTSCLDSKNSKKDPSTTTLQRVRQPLSGDLVWSMVNVNRALQGDAHIIQVKGGQTILIDAGYYDEAQQSLIPFIEAKGLSSFDKVFITHPHRDHYEGLSALVNDGVQIKELYFNLPDKERCDFEIPWGCHYESVISHQKKAVDHGAELKIATAGQVFDLGNQVTLKILYAFDGVHTPVGKTDVNDMSLILRLEYQKHRILFAGDLNKPVGNYISGNDQGLEDLKASFLKVPHHGVESVANDLFFERVHPQYALVPSPQNLWCSPRSLRLRDWFNTNHISVYVNGLSGHVQVLLKADQLQIVTEKPGSPPC
ncbi:MBL fold metallo-hydrolase [Deltaproteobacteria bacterium TL4]